MILNFISRYFCIVCGNVAGFLREYSEIACGVGVSVLYRSGTSRKESGIAKKFAEHKAGFYAE